MTKNNRSNFERRLSGLSYIILSLLAISIFIFYGNSINTGGIIAGVAGVIFGVATILAPRISPLFSEVNNRWTGLFWALCGVGIIGIGVVSTNTVGRWINGIVLGGGLMIYGVLIALDR